ncbi:hypothetical protein [Enterococcus italicus]|uniref:hypothetical protein n=1 Tax=Enterococcus italicus TaxID=246144 RepID=UPI003F45A7CA
MIEESPILVSLALNQRLKQLQEIYSQNPYLMKQEQLQRFVFELRDYTEAVEILADDAPGKFADTPVDEDTVALLQAQQHSLRLVVQQGQSLETGEGRRLEASLKGLIELNHLLLQDAKQFEAAVANEAAIKEEPKQPKTSFFKRLFGKSE